MTEGSRIRILLIEDHAMVEEELHLLLQSYPNVEIVDRA
jgi:DNA-binding NarL/FixJ family response regulator